MMWRRSITVLKKLNKKQLIKEPPCKCVNGALAKTAHRGWLLGHWLVILLGKVNVDCQNKQKKTSKKF